MCVFLLEISHQTTPLEVREKFALSSEDITRLQAKIKELRDVEECLILNTCNRVEIYICGKNKSSINALMHTYCEFHNVEQSYFSQYVKISQDCEVIKHLFSLAAGLESQIIGETEILGQVKQAYADAQNGDSLGPCLNRLFQKSFQVAKWIRSNTGIGKGQVSVGNIAVDLAERIFGELKKCRILVIGTGDIGQQTLKALKNRGASSVTIASRTLGKARMIAAEYNGVAIDFEHIDNVIQYFSIVICATSSTLPVITHKTIQRIMNERVDEPLFLIDQAMPRDIEPSVGNITNVYLYNLDDLSSIANENLKSRQAEIEKCQAVIDEKSQYTWNSLQSNDDEYQQSAVQ